MVVTDTTTPPGLLGRAALSCRQALTTLTVARRLGTDRQQAEEL
ncbi:hypothetical protein [Hymenobacter sp. AT01-02]|nr:hypothetical protein [Hymenobacter sp. AT01-02]